MKSILLLFCIFSLNGYANELYNVKTKIKNVIVYQQGAQIQRQGSYSVKKGITELKISGVSALINPSTLQINASGNIIIIDTKHSIHYPEPTPINTNNILPLKIQKEISFLKDSLFDMGYAVTHIENKISVLNSQKRIIENNGTIKGEGKVNDSIPLLQDALSFYHKEMNAINEALLDLNKSYNLLSKQKNKMELRLSQLNNYNKNIQHTTTPTPAPIHEIIITVSAKESTSGRINATYLISDAGWTPLYDLRSSNKTNKIDLTYKAQVYQNSGIDWNGIKLNLSTNNPYANKTKPILNPWYLDYTAARHRNTNKKKESELYLSKTQQEDNSLDEEILEDETDSYSIGKDISVSAQTANQFMTTIEQLVSVEYAIDLPYTIKSDNQKNMVLVKTSSLKTDYLYYTVPKLDPSVYLIAQITNLDELNLIPGNATIFHDGSYLGNTYINPNTLSDTMDLSLGKTNNITIKRNLLKKATKQKIVGDKIEKTYAYQITIKNLNKTSINIIIEDQVPLTRNNEIEVTYDNLSKGQLNEVNGFIQWKLKLKPSALNQLDLVYTVKHLKTTPINMVER